MAEVVSTVHHTEHHPTSPPTPQLATIGYPPDECLESYLQGIARIPVLAPEEERRLARRAVRGDRIAQHQLVQSNLRLVVKVAARYAKYGIPLCDLIQEGNLGLMKAVERFDWRRGTRFSTYAVYWIREAITRALTTGVHATSLSGHAFKRFRRLSDKLEELAAETLREPTLPEIAAAMETTTHKVSRIMAAATFPLSLNESSTSERRSTPVEEIACECTCDPAELVQGGPTPEQVRKAIDTLLDARERLVILRSFGLEGQSPATLKEIASELGVSIERVRQIRDRALLKLRRTLSNLVL